MMNKAPAMDQIQPYIEALETRLRNLPDEDRTDLMSDLESHLREIIVDESDTSLAERIGPPHVYVDELAASIGLDEDGPSTRSLAEAISDSLRRFSNHANAEKVRRLWTEMRPAWWTLRGFAIGLFLSWNYLGPGDPDLLWIMQFVSGALVIVLIGVSMRIGRNQDRSRNWKWVSVAVSIAGVLASISFIANISARMDPNYQGQNSFPYGLITQEDVEFMQHSGITPEEFFEQGFFYEQRWSQEDGMLPMITTSLPSGG